MRPVARLLRQSHILRRIPQSRHITTYSTPTQKFRENWKKAQRDNPVLLPFLLVGSIASVSVLGLMLYDDYTRVAPKFQAYPKAVEQRLRIALHYTHVEPDPVQAETHFTEALRAAEQCGMDPFSKEVMGIRIRLAEMLEHFGHVKSSIEVLNGIVKICEDGLAAHPPSRSPLLRGIIEARVKMAELYESDYMQNPAKAKEVLSDAIGLLVKETKNPQDFTENNVGFSLAEVAAMFSQMGDLYATSGEEANAVQTYMLTLQPLRASCNGEKSCKEAQILSNIASTMAIAMKKPGAKINGKPATKELLSQGRRATLKWADQAIATAGGVKDDDEICVLSRLSAEMTKADLLLEDDQKIRAKEAFGNLLPRLKELGLDQLVKVAEDGLQKASK